MTTYKEIRGTQIEAVATDPSNPVEGQVWYNTTSNVLKGQAATTTGAWATGNNVNTARNKVMLSGAGTQDAALMAGGLTPTVTGATELYNGTNWTEVNDLTTARQSGGCTGTANTAAIVFAGYDSNFTAKTETWNGTNWTEVNDVNSLRTVLGAAGTSTSALGYGGNPPGSPPFSALTELWNGTNWTEVNDLNQARFQVYGTGATGTAALCIGGEVPPQTAATESWNGTNWTEVNDLNAAKSTGAASGEYTDALIFGGNPTPGTSGVQTESWNGTNWTSEANLNTGRRELGGAGATAGASIGFGGETPGGSLTAATEEFTGAGAGVTRTFTDS